MNRRLILDVDTGTDDAIAIMMAGLSPDLDLIACTTVWGNHDVDTTTENTLRVLDHIDHSDVPVYRGLGKPYAPIPFLFPDYADSDRTIVHPHDFPIASRTSDVRATPAVEWLVETLRAATERVTLVPVAPLTNIAAAITLDPRIVDAVDEVVLMGGAHALGNVTPAAEANIWHDPVAADVVFQAGFERLVLVPLDATHEAIVSLDQTRALRATGTPAAVAAAAIIEQRITGYNEILPTGAADTAPVHDALCIAYLLDPAVLDVAPYRVQIDTVSPLSFGKTIVDVDNRARSAANCHVALGADATLFNDLMFRTLSEGR
ncbi:nucleoside hydrolase [Microbacterium sp. NPDC087589]|uniref:nucleoside hydrolase n=1 Tax=Microbacterium sp. NPDC087589 TaxID=3364191 RepID=UPI0037F6FB0B